MKTKDSEIFINLPSGERLFKNQIIKKDSGELTIQKFKQGYQIANRTSIINHLIILYNFKTYLEIGVRDGRNFNLINISKKIGVDPNHSLSSDLISTETSNDFFKNNKDKFDLIFIDGLHLEYQVDQDIENALLSLNDNGIIIMHDCNPPTEFHQRENYEINGEYPAWNGTVWRSFSKCRINNKDLEMYCVNCDWGVGIIKKGNQNLYNHKGKLNYIDLINNRKKLLNLISVNEFLQKFKN